MTETGGYDEAPKYVCEMTDETLRLTAEDIVSAVLGEYEIDRESAEKDVAEFLGKIREFGIID